MACKNECYQWKAKRLLTKRNGSSWTSHSSIFSMDTVVATQRIGRTVNESGLSSTTLDIVQPDLTSTIGETSSDGHRSCTQGALKICLATATYTKDIPWGINPNCLQATWASAAPQKSSHTVPQILLLQTSTRPLLAVPPCSLIAPVKHPGMNIE